MAQDIQPGIVPQRLVQPVISPQHYLPPTTRDLRSQAVQRLQVGLFGLAGMLLMVGLANIVMDRARMSDAEVPEVNPVLGTEAAKAGSDPLADIGVAPAADPTAATAINNPAH